MRLSDHSTDSAADVLVQITPFVANIAKDQKVIDRLRTPVDKNGKTVAGVMIEGIERLSDIVPMLLKDHREDLFGIIGAVNKKSASEIGAQKLAETLAQIREVTGDEELLDFFASFSSRGKTV